MTRTAVRTPEGTFYVTPKTDAGWFNVFRSAPVGRRLVPMTSGLYDTDWLGSIDTHNEHVYPNQKRSDGHYVGHDKGDARRRMLAAVIRAMGRTSKTNPPARQNRRAR